ncbi:MAG: ribosome biogenesis factor YjgA [Steroidobacteraceae bacterium]
MSPHPRHPQVSEDSAADLVDEASERPSKSARKRAAHAAQALGEQLIGLKESDLLALSLPETLLEAVREARRIRARGGLARQRQYIGKLMRELDTEALALALERLRR